MQDYRSELASLSGQLTYLLDTPEDQRIAERIVQIADRHNDIEYQLKGRASLVDSSTWVGQPEKALVAYAYLLSVLDERPEVFSKHLDVSTTLWSYKWIIDRLPLFPTISREQIDTAWADMERRFRAFGRTEAAILQYRFKVKSEAGHYGAAEDALRELDRYTGPGRQLVDCGACFADCRVQHYVRREDYAKAIEEGQPILKGKLKCMEIPSRFYEQLVVPYLLTGQPDKATEMVAKMKIKPLPHNIFMNAMAIVALTATGKLTRALEITERNWSVVHATREQYTPYHFYLAVRYLLRSLQQDGQTHGQTATQRRPPLLPRRPGVLSRRARKLPVRQDRHHP